EALERARLLRGAWAQVRRVAVQARGGSVRVAPELLQGMAVRVAPPVWAQSLPALLPTRSSARRRPPRWAPSLLRVPVAPRQGRRRVGEQGRLPLLAR